MAYIHVKNYEHYNRSFKNWNSPYGRYISSRADYEKALHEEGMITEEQAEREGATKSAPRKDYKITSDTVDLINSVAATSDKHGNIKPGDRAINELARKKKLSFNYNKSLCPKYYEPEGGFKEET